LAYKLPGVPFVPILLPNRAVLFAKIVGNRQVLCRSGRILFCNFYRLNLPVFLIKYRKILVVTYGSVNFSHLDTEVVEFFEVLDRYLYPLGPVETRPIDYFDFSLYLLSVFLVSIKFLGFSLTSFSLVECFSSSQP